MVRAVRSLAHRGPDDYGYFNNERVALVHTRLSIIDLTVEGRQPLLSHNGRYLGIFNGELYDYDQHRHKLQSAGVHFKSHSDSEVFLNLFTTQGIKAFEHLSGEFAFIIYDFEEAKLYFGRDIHGVKPLFMKFVDGEIEVASEGKALISSVQPELDSTYIQQFFSGLIVPPRTAIKHVEHVLPGRLYCFDLNNKKLEWKNYDFLFSKTNKRSLKNASAEELVYEELNASVRRRLKADVPVGAYLSGGLDSSLVAALMMENGANPKTFTVGFEDPKFDETTVAVDTAKHLGLSHHVVYLNQENYLPALKRSILAFENPIFNTHGAAKNLLSELAASHVKVVLSGEGADEWFGGYPYLRIQKILEFNKRHENLALPNLDLFHQKEGDTARGHLNGESEFYSSLVLKHFGGRYPALLRRLVNPRNLRYLIAEKPDKVIDDALSDLKKYMIEDMPSSAEGVSEFDSDLWLGLRTDLLHYVLSNVGDRQEMSHSLEGRTPFLDQRLVKLARTLSPGTLVRGLCEKYVLKQIAKKRLPEAISKKKKFAFFAPSEILFSKQNQDELVSYMQIAKATLDFMPWKKIDMILAADPDPGRRQNVMTAFFSMGVLTTHLADPHLHKPRGYKLPVKPNDLLGHGFSYPAVPRVGTFSESRLELSPGR